MLRCCQHHGVARCTARYVRCGRSLRSWRPRSSTSYRAGRTPACRARPTGRPAGPRRPPPDACTASSRSTCTRDPSGDARAARGRGCSPRRRRRSTCAIGLTFTRPRPTSKATIGVRARVDASSRRKPVIQAACPESAFASGTTLRAPQHAVGVVEPTVVGVDLGLHDPEVQVVALPNVLDVPERLGEVVLRVEEHDLDARVDLRREVDEHAVLERRREHETVAELARRPTRSQPTRACARAPSRSRRAHAGRVSTRDPYGARGGHRSASCRALAVADGRLVRARSRRSRRRSRVPRRVRGTRRAS